MKKEKTKKRNEKEGNERKGKEGKRKLHTSSPSLPDPFSTLPSLVVAPKRKEEVGGSV